jgi:hypothetical protein
MTDSTRTIDALQDEIVALRQQLAASERTRQAAEQRVQLYEAIVKQLPISVSVWHLEQPDDPRSFRLINANPLNLQTAGFDVGAQVVLTGIRPEVAQTLVGLGADLSGIVTCGSLQSGIAYATSRN